MWIFLYVSPPHLCICSFLSVLFSIFIFPSLQSPAPISNLQSPAPCPSLLTLHEIHELLELLSFGGSGKFSVNYRPLILQLVE